MTRRKDPTKAAQEDVIQTWEVYTSLNAAKDAPVGSNAVVIDLNAPFDTYQVDRLAVRIELRADGWLDDDQPHRTLRRYASYIGQSAIHAVRVSRYPKESQSIAGSTFATLLAISQSVRHGSLSNDRVEGAVESALLREFETQHDQYFTSIKELDPVYMKKLDEVIRDARRVFYAVEAAAEAIERFFAKHHLPAAPPPPGNARRDLEIEFVRAAVGGHYWRMMTGQDPPGGRDSLLVDFLAAAWRDLRFPEPTSYLEGALGARVVALIAASKK